jgi:hypothetical protein
MRRLAAVLIIAAAVAAVPSRVAGQRVLRGDRAWNTSHVALAGAFTLALWVDAAQTREAMARGFQETNPILGPHPSVGRINSYTAVAGLTVLGAAAALPARFRSWVLGAALAVETFAIAGTVRQGIAIRFP